MVRDSGSGVYLDGGEHGEILLPNRYVPNGLRPGDRLEVFVYRDSEDRLVATTERPHATVGEIAVMRVVSVNQRVGAFLDWGLAKDLLLPFREQLGPVKEGDKVTVRVYLDTRTRRIVATMKLDRGLQPEPRTFRAGEAVEFLISEQTPLGYRAVVEGSHPGLLYHEGVAVPVELGQKMKGYVRAVRPDGKLDLSLDQSGYRRVGPLSDQILQVLQQAGGRMALDDGSPPEAVREAFGVSKKSFKQALGALYKRRRIRFTKPGIQLLDAEEWSPGHEARVRRQSPAGKHRPDNSKSK